jgi:fructuronate reductase
MRYSAGIDEAGRTIEVADPLAAEFARIARDCGDNPAALVRGFLSLRTIFGDDLPSHPRFVNAVTAWLAALLVDGAAHTVSRAVTQTALESAA